MIERYTRAEMKNHWSDENRFKTWLEVELQVLSVLGRHKIIPQQTSKKIRSQARIHVRRILELEKTLKHDVIAFTTSIAEQSGDAGRFFHYGLTSSDVVDTAFSILLSQSMDLILDELDEVLLTLKKQALRYQKLPCIGRTHGVHAEPTSFGLKFLGWYAELKRQSERLKNAKLEIAVGKLSGAVGSYGALSPVIEREALTNLRLAVEDVATQVLPRDRHAAYFSAIAGLGASIERVSVDLRHLQRTEVNEIEEEFSAGQKGSSAMPHKKNPISAENLSGCARLLKSYSQAALENVALWHERDISHSAVERVIGPDATTLAHYMLVRLNTLLKGIVVKRENVDKNLALTQGIYFSGHVLLKLVEKGVSREDAYVVVQRAAHRAWQNQKWFLDELRKEMLIQEKFSLSELKNICNVKNYLKNVDVIYKRVLRAPQKTKKKSK